LLRYLPPHPPPPPLRPYTTLFRSVVRQPAVGDAVEAEVGRMPWLHDRRLLTLQLPDDSLPANRAILLDWPVPYQAEWVGAPPRLDRKSTRLNSSHRTISYAVFCLK